MDLYQIIIAGDYCIPRKFSTAYFSRNLIIWAIANKYYRNIDERDIFIKLRSADDEKYLIDYINENPYIFDTDIAWDIYKALTPRVQKLYMQRNVKWFSSDDVVHTPDEYKEFYHLYIRSSPLLNADNIRNHNLCESHLQSLAQNEFINDFDFYEIMLKFGAPDSDNNIVCEQLRDSRPVLYILWMNHVNEDRESAADKISSLRQILDIADMAHHCIFMPKPKYYRPEYQRCFNTLSEKSSILCDFCTITRYISKYRLNHRHNGHYTQAYLMMREYYPHYLSHYRIHDNSGEHSRPTANIILVTPIWFNELSSHSDERRALIAHYGKSSNVIECLYNGYESDIPIIHAISTDVYDSPCDDISIWRILDDYPNLITHEYIFKLLDFVADRERIAPVLFRNSNLFMRLFAEDHLDPCCYDFVKWYRAWFNARLRNILYEIARTRFIFGADVAHKIAEHYKIDHGILHSRAK
jgi:hypothetical protein